MAKGQETTRQKDIARRAFSFMLVLLILLGNAAAENKASEFRTVWYVADGDTLILDRREKVRLIGIDTPELYDSRRNAKDAKQYGVPLLRVNDTAQRAKAFVEREFGGRRVRVEYDEERKDKYGRTLAYVFRADDNLFLNEALLRDGYAFAYPWFPFKYKEKFKSLENEARKNRLGLWTVDE